MDSYTKGDTVLRTLDIKQKLFDSTGETENFIDPETLILIIIGPNDYIETFTFGEDDEMIKRDVGRYLFKIDTTDLASGIYRMKWNTTGGIIIACEDKFRVREVNALYVG